MKLINYIKEDEFFKLLKAEKKDKYKLAYKLAFGSGLRISEIVGYKRSPLGRDAREQNPDKSPREGGVQDSHKAPVEIQPLQPNQIDLQARTIKVIGGKGMKDRMVPLFPGFKESDLKLLPLKITRSGLQAHFSTHCMRVLGRKCNFHQLRHGFAVASVKRKVQLPFIQHALGHTRLDTTGIYTQASPDDVMEAFRKGWGE